MADIEIRQGVDPGLFVNPHTVCAATGNGRVLFVLTGIVLVNYRGNSTQNWRNDRFIITLSLDEGFRLAELQGLRGQPQRGFRFFRLENWAPFVTINAIHNAGAWDNGGWAVDSFSLVDPRQPVSVVNLHAHAAVRDTDGFLFRIGYNVTLLGSFEDVEGP